MAKHIIMSKYKVIFQMNIVPEIVVDKGIRYYFLDGICEEKYLQVKYYIKIPIEQNLKINDRDMRLRFNGAKCCFTVSCRQCQFVKQANGLKRYSCSYNSDKYYCCFDFEEIIKDTIQSNNMGVKELSFQEKRRQELKDKWNINHPFRGGGFTPR